MKVRKIIRGLHRDVGYIAFGLIIIYSISGIAVNHVNDWNPNYNISKDTLIISSNIDSSLSTTELAKILAQYFSINDSIKSSFRSNPNKIDIFFQKKTLSANLQTKIAVLEKVENRFILRESNFLHLNHAKKIWTWIADIFAVSLIFLAVSGLIMIKGKLGFLVRGKWFMLLGLIIPILFLFLYFY